MNHIFWKGCEIIMQKLYRFLARNGATMTAFVAVVMSQSGKCAGIFGQPEMPECLKK